MLLQVGFRWAGEANIALAIEPVVSLGTLLRMVPKVSNLRVGLHAAVAAFGFQAAVAAVAAAAARVIPCGILMGCILTSHMHMLSCSGQ